MRVPRSPNHRRLPRSRSALAMLGGGVLALGMVAGGAAAAAAPSSPSSPAACRMAGGKIKHVIYIQFDNVHYTRDNPRVPSDLQQMPNLLKFVTSSGALLSQEHTPLIAHTANDIVTSETGLYGSGTGTAVANEYHYYTSAADGSSDEAGDFAYWTDPIVDYFTSYAGTPVGDSHTTLVGHNGKNPPAPWVPLHPRRLRLRLGRGGRHRTREPGAGRGQGIRREVGRRQGGGQPQAVRQGGRRLRGPVGALRARSRPCARSTTRCPTRWPPSRAGTTATARYSARSTSTR